MVTRVSTLGQQNILLDTVLRNEKRVFDRQEQVSSGNRSPNYRGIARDVGTLSAAKNVEIRTQGYLDNNRDLNRRLEIYDATLQGLQEVASTLRQDIIAAINTNSGLALRDKIDDLYDTAVSLFNTRDSNGRFVFSGSRIDQQTVTATTTNALAALGSGNHAQAFANNTVKAQTQISDARSLTVGVLGTEVGTELMDIFSRLALFDNGTTDGGFPPAGAFVNPLNDNQKDFLISVLDESTEAFNKLNEAVAINGVNLKSLENIQELHQKDLTFIKIFISDIQDVNAAEAVSQLNLDNLALESSFRVFGQLTRLSLIDFV